MALNQADILESLEQACAELTPSEFIFEFLEAFGFPRSTITRLRNAGDSRNVGEDDDIALRKRLYFKAVKDSSEVGAAADALKASSVVSRNDIRFVIVTDFKMMVAYDLKADERLEIELDELPKQYGFFLPLAGYEKAIMFSEHPADLKASEKMGQLFDQIKERNELTKDEDIHALNVFLTRLLFCFFAEDTGIFESGQMTSAIQSYTKKDGSDVDQFFYELFAVLNLKPDAPERKAMPAHFQAFPYVNGDLFAVDEPVPEFGARSRRILVDCGALDWSEINPDIFGSMFQAVIDPEQRGNLGQHYTSIPNIIKVIQPLFLDGLHADLEKARNNEKRLKALLVRLQNIKIFDPACGSGNFLIIAYKELRKLEMEIIDALNTNGAQSEMYYSGIRLSQFYGIEIDDFAHEVAKLSLWLAEHQMNTAFKAKFGYAEAALPLKDSGNITAGNSLHLDWSEVCAKENAQGDPHEVYICGNPPFAGYNSRISSQNESMDLVFSDFKKYKDLDFVTSWFWLGALYIKETKNSLAFVSTNSITQGEQVSLIWPRVFNLGLNISFAWQTFGWTNNAKNNAGVHVVIIGLAHKKTGKKLFKPDGKLWDSHSVNNISPYLIEGSNLAIESRTKPLSAPIRMVRGSQPTDGGNLFFTTEQKDQLLAQSSESAIWIKKVIGADEFLNSKNRWVLWLTDATSNELKNLSPIIKRRLELVSEMRLKSTNKQTQALSKTPHVFWQDNHPRNGSYIVLPRVTTRRRHYLPLGIIGSDTVCTDLLQIVPGGGLLEFSILSSTIHMDWMKVVAGRLGASYRYSAVVYNTFPWPDLSEAKRKETEALAEEVLLVREDYPSMTLAELYDPDKMPVPLLEAHKTLDRAVEKLYRNRPFRDASERLEHLFARYEKLIAEEKKSKRSK